MSESWIGCGGRGGFYEFNVSGSSLDAGSQGLCEIVDGGVGGRRVFRCKYWVGV